MPNIAKRTLKFTQGLGYCTLTAGAGIGTLILATATCGLAMTGVGIPLAFVTGVGAGGCGYGTVFFAKKTGHKFVRAFEEGEHHHHHGNHDVSYGFTAVDVHTFTGSNAADALKKNNTSKSTSANDDQLRTITEPQVHKPLFSVPVTETAPTAQIIGDTSPTIDPNYENSTVSPAA
ncbi:hypothetical protein [Legionella bononiensis]|uniref:Transmembrane protein n=1 Tax=Legionella bononiensis TaxID=2793102 RepID=A0ABS1W6R0_9GAMM|nr:hypothetical protein [Legionella bononiensis]MBL7478447.1 hypothetical protein [Legionella bononiensis]MBL7525044.1 hypothetical protein [Legionella bononiensis]MBL7561340.1 hypothetical protein [Legionella bononiensis]